MGPKEPASKSMAAVWSEEHPGPEPVQHREPELYRWKARPELQACLASEFPEPQGRPDAEASAVHPCRDEPEGLEHRSSPLVRRQKSGRSWREFRDVQLRGRAFRAFRRPAARG